MIPMDKFEGVSRADAYQPIECCECDATADLKARGASRPADIGWLHRHANEGVANYCPDCRPDTEADR